MIGNPITRRCMNPENNFPINFRYEETNGQAWPAMQAEHQLLVDALRLNRGRGSIDFLNHRVTEPGRQAALYFIMGIGMGRGRCFALVQGGDILWIQVISNDISPDANDTIDVIKVEIPERLDGRRTQFMALIAEAVSAYYRARPPILGGSSESQVRFDETVWEILPQRYSRLFWKTECAAWSRRHQPKARIALNAVKSPLAVVLAMLVAVFYSKANGYSGGLPLIIGGACFWYLADDYDDDVYFWPWLAGVNRSKNTLAMLGYTMGRSFAVPLRALTVAVRLDPATPGMCTLRIRNTSAFVVTHISISAIALADLVAPGFVASQRESNGSLDVSKIEAAFPSRTRRWLLPFQALEWQVPLSAEFPLQMPGANVEAIVCISRRVSGQRKNGAQTYTLPVHRA